MGLALGLSVVALLGYLLTLRRSFASLSDLVLAAFVLTTGQVLLLEVALAALGLLRPAPVAVANGLVAAGLLFLGCRRQPRDTLRWIGGRLSGFARLLRRAPLALLVLLLLVALAVWVLWLIAVWPESSYDGIAYHLPIAFSRLDQGDLRILPGWPPWVSSYPEYGELLIIWTVLFDRLTTWVDGVQWFFWPAGMLAAYALARKVGAAPRPALLGSVLLAFAPGIVLQARAAYNDLIVTALFLIALNLLLVEGLLPALVAGLAMGLVVGTKYGGIAYALAGGAGLLLTAGRKVWQRGSGFWPRLLAYGLPVLALGAPWYLSNWLHFGNPLWPFTVRLGGNTLFYGMRGAEGLYAYGLLPHYRSLPYWLLKAYFWFEPRSLYTYDAHYEGLGPLWPILGLPAALYLLLTGVRERRPAWTMTLVGLGGLYLAQPNNWKPRYSLFILALGAVGVAWVLHQGSTLTRRVTCLLLIVGILWTLWTVGPMEMVPLDRVEAYARMPATLRPSTSQADLPAYRWLEENTRPGDRVVYGYALFLIAPLWENDLDNHVQYIPTRIPEFWHAEVVRRQPTYLFVQRHFSNRWIGTDERLVPVYADAAFVIYRVLSAEEEPP